MKSFVFAVCVGLCVMSVSAAGIPKQPELTPEPTSVEGRQYHGVETWSGPGSIMFAPVIAVAFLLVLWVAAYNTIRDAPPRFGVNYQAKPLERVSTGAYPEVVAAASGAQASTVAVGARAFDQLTHRVLSSIEKFDTVA